MRVRVLVLSASDDLSNIHGVVVANEDVAAEAVDRLRRADTGGLFFVRNLIVDSFADLLDYVEGENAIARDEANAGPTGWEEG